MSDVPPTSDPTLSQEELERVDRVCDRFEEAWRSGQRPELKAFVEELDTPVGTVLLRELLKVELAYRLQRNELPTAQEYWAIFPEHASLIEVVFAQAMERPCNSEGVTTPPNSSAADPESAGSSESPTIPEFIDRYKVVRRLGRGAYGEVYLAHDPDMDCSVAIKVPSARLLRTDRAKEEFLREARSVARLRDEGIVRALNFGEADGRCYIVYEYIEGESLAERIAADPVPPDEAAQIVAAVAEALHYAHMQGILHRDVKPANILLDRQGKPKLTDFGLAVREEDLGGERGRLAGTLPYMSPEQVRREGDRLDGRSDIYSLGVVLYELLCGRRPFTATTEDELIDQILHREAEPPGQIRDSIPAAMERICLKALSKQINDRYTTAKDMAEELSKLIHPPWRLYRLLDIHQVGTTANIQILCNNISDELTADRLLAELRVVLETSEIKGIVLDLGNMQEASASGFRVFHFLCQQLQQRGGKPKLCNVNDSIREVLRKNRLDSLCELVPNAPRLPRPVPRRIVRHYIPEEVLSTGDRHMTVAAHRERSNQRLAVKLMPVLSGEQEEPCLTQMREFAELRHPALVRMHDLGIEDGYSFVATDLLSCPSLATWLAGRRPTWQEAAMIIAKVAEALAHMHSLGVYHGDVRPFTIYVNEDLAPLLVLPEPSALKSGIAGTPVYMAPEQLEGQRLKGQSDIYSLGVILYEMLCKRLPYNADTTITIWEMLRRVRHEEPIPPRQYAPAIPAQLEEICLKAMAKRVNDRYRAADRFEAALDHYVARASLTQQT